GITLHGGIHDGDTVSSPSDTLAVSLHGGTGGIAIHDRTGADGDIITQGGDFEARGEASLSVGSISTQGMAPDADGNGAAGGDITLISTHGSIAVDGSLDARGGAGTSQGTPTRGGHAGSVTLTAGADDLVIIGDVIADGGDGHDETGPAALHSGHAGAITLVADNGELTLQGNVSAQGTTPDAAADITVSAETLKIDGSGEPQIIAGANQVNLSSAERLALTHDLTITAGAGATLDGGIDYDGIGAGALTVNAGDGVTLHGGIHDGDTVSSPSDTLAVSLHGRTGGIAIYDRAGADGDIITQGGDFEAQGEAALAVGSISTQGTALDADGNGTAGGDITLISTHGSIAVDGSLDARGGAGAQPGTPTRGGHAGSVTLTAGAGDLAITGDVIADGGDGYDETGPAALHRGHAGAITLLADNGMLKLQGNVSAQGATPADPDAAADITLSAQTLKLHGSGESQTIAGTNQVNLSAAERLALTHDLTITAGAGAALDGGIDYDGIGAGTLTVNAGDGVTLGGGIYDSDPVASDDQLTISIAGGLGAVAVAENIHTGGADFIASGASYATDATLSTGAGKASIDVEGDATLGGMDVGGSLSVAAGNDISQASGTSLLSASDVSLSGHDIVLDGNNRLSGDLDLKAAGDVILRNDTATSFSNLAAKKLTLSSADAVSQTEAAKVVLERLQIHEADSLDLRVSTDDSANPLHIDGIQSSGDVTIHAADMRLSGNIDSRGTVNLNSTNGIFHDGDVLISAPRIDMNAGTGVGAVDARLSTRTNMLNVVSAGGDIGISNTGKVTVNLKAQQGNIRFENDESIEIDRIVTSATSGDVHVTSYEGSIIAKRQKLPAASEAEADVVAHSAFLSAIKGTLGELRRPIVVFPAKPQHIDTPTFTESSLLDVLTGLSGEQVTQIENMGAIDPAIFSAVRNFDHADVSILMPPDQRYEDEPED
ncbi:MAG: hypothetical protein WDA11_02115, partial [Thiohalomonadaceae bacterium]